MRAEDEGTRAVKKVEVNPGIARNIIKIDAHFFRKQYVTEDEHHHLLVGLKRSYSSDPVKFDQPKKMQQGSNSDDHSTNQKKLLDTLKPTYELIKKVMLARHKRRFTEFPDHVLAVRTDPASLPTKVTYSERFSGESLQRLFSSEHCYGDPQLEIRSPVHTGEEMTLHDPRNGDIVPCLMHLAAESSSAWCREHDLPVVYRTVLFQAGFPKEKFQNIRRHEAYIVPTQGSSLVPVYLPQIPQAQSMQITNPLRKFRDLINQYQITAYLKAAANGHKTTPTYPYSREDLRHHMHRKVQSATIMLHRSERVSMVFRTLFRAFHFQEALLPEVFDVYYRRFLTSKVISEDRRAVLLPFNIQVHVEPSKEGFEALAKPGQYLPCKIININIRKVQVEVQAVGPPSDQATVVDHPELTREMQHLHN